MRDRPDGFGERELRLALAEGWQIRAVTTRYAPVGGGSYHWHNGYWGRPRAGRSWERGHWEHGDRGYHWNRGHWR